MDKKKSVTYDPENSDPTQAQLETISKMSIDDLEAKDLASPEVVKVLFLNQRNLLLQLRKSEQKIEFLEGKNDELSSIKEKLKVKLARNEVFEDIGFIEILISILSGFSINMLVVDFSNGIGWFLLILSVSVLIFTRFKTKKVNSDE